MHARTKVPAVLPIGIPSLELLSSIWIEGTL